MCKNQWSCKWFRKGSFYQYDVLCFLLSLWNQHLGCRSQLLHFRFLKWLVHKKSNLGLLDANLGVECTNDLGHTKTKQVPGQCRMWTCKSIWRRIQAQIGISHWCQLHPALAESPRQQTLFLHLCSCLVNSSFQQPTFFHSLVASATDEANSTTISAEYCPLDWLNIDWKRDKMPSWLRNCWLTSVNVCRHNLDASQENSSIYRIFSTFEQLALRNNLAGRS